MARAPKKSSKKVAASQKLAEYRRKRHFDVTPEPSGDAPAVKAPPEWTFVIQKHAACRLHYDFRLELDGVLLSWAVPKGPSLKPGERRLAARTEDHPLEYAGFEGIIPADEYGGGTVVVWDRGTWQPEGDPREAMKKGRLTFTLAGEKLRGRWHLVRTGGASAKESWLLMKGRDDAASDSRDIVEERPESVITGRTLEEVAKDRDRIWHSDRAPAGQLNDLVAQLPASIPFTNLDKVLWPELGLTKGALIAYLAVVSQPMLVHLSGRPLTLVRCPDGRHKHCFYQKHAGAGTPASIRRVDIREDDGTTGEYLFVEDLPGLLALAQLGVLEIHTWGCHADQVERPDQIVMDLDPDPTIGWDPVVETALDLRRRLRALGLESFVKTTGGKGLHVVAPVARRTPWEELKGFTKALAEQLEADAPTRYTTNPLKARRKHKIFVDYLRNGRGASAIAAYAVRAREGAPVATPITWDELEAGVDPLDFTVTTVPRRLGSGIDPWAGHGDLRQSITAAAKRKVGM